MNSINSSKQDEQDFENASTRERLLQYPIQNKLDIYQALTKVGSENTYQKQFFLFACFVWLFGAASILSITFTFEKPSFQCPSEIKNDDCENWVCSQSNYVQYLDSKPDSFVMKFEPPLICERQNIADFSIAIIYSGSALGYIVSLYIADNFGKMPAIVICWVLSAIGTLIPFFSGSSIAFGVFGFALAQFGSNASTNIVFTFMNDHSLGKFREYSQAAISPFYGIAGALLVLLMKISNNYRYLMLNIGLPILISCIYLFYLQEPPLFLYQKDKKKTVEVLNKIAQINKREEVSLEELKDLEVEIGRKRFYGISDLFKFPSLKNNAVFSGGILFMIQLSFYGSNLTFSQIGLDTQVNVLASSYADTLGYIVIIPIIPFIKRKHFCVLGRIIFCIIFILFYWIQIPNSCGDTCYEKNLQSILVAIARFFLTFEWAIAFIYFAELFPTTVRTIGLGFASFIGDIGSIFCSYFISYLISLGINPLFGMGVISFISIVFYYPLDETFQKPIQPEIPELIEIEMSNLIKKKSPSSLQQ